MSGYDSASAAGFCTQVPHSRPPYTHEGYYRGPLTSFTAPLQTLEQNTRLNQSPQNFPTTHRNFNVRMKADAFVANDPWRPQIRTKRQKDTQTFDDIPLPSKDFHSQPVQPTRYMYGNAVISPINPEDYPPIHIQHSPAIPNAQECLFAPPPMSHVTYSNIHGMTSDLADSSQLPDASCPISPIGSPISSASTGSPRTCVLPIYNRPQTSISEPSLVSSLGSLVRPPHSSVQKWKSIIEFLRKKPSQSKEHIFDGKKPGYADSYASSLSDSSHHLPMYATPSQPFPHPPIYSSHQPYPYLRPHLHHQPCSYTQPPQFEIPSQTSSQTLVEAAFQFILVTLPGQVYLNLLLRLPSLYFSRVARIFEEADLTLPELKKMALETASHAKGFVDMHTFESNNVPHYDRLKSTWESFIDSIMREWKTFNVISVLLLSAILTILQIESAADDPITRYSALFSMICALVSLLFGCMYIIRFGTMRKTYKAAEWALEAKKTKAGIWWNVWVMLAMPAIWLTWSIILYIISIMSFIWRTSPQDSDPPIVLSQIALLIVRIAISSILGLSLVYGVLIMSTFRRYGGVMDRAWKRRIDGWIEEKFCGIYPPMYPTFYPDSPYGVPSSLPRYPSCYPSYPPNDYAYDPQYNYQVDQHTSYPPNVVVHDYPNLEQGYYRIPVDVPCPSLAPQCLETEFVPGTHNNVRSQDADLVVGRQEDDDQSSQENVTEPMSSIFVSRRANHTWQSTPSTHQYFSRQQPSPSLGHSSRGQGARRCPLARPPAPHLTIIPGSPRSGSSKSPGKDDEDRGLDELSANNVYGLSSPTTSTGTLSSLGLDIPADPHS